MRAKPLLTFVLLALVAASLAYTAAKQFRGPAASQPAPPRDGLVVYYFHGDARCTECLRIEACARKALTDGFAPELRQGLVRWQVVNVDRPGNEHFVKDYKLLSRSVVLAAFRGGKQARWRNLGKVWNLVGSERDLTRYVHDEIAAELKDPR
jgi:hypothetical protein